MRCLVVYDIPDNRIRTRVADCCLDYGLDRIQYSAFLGDLTRTHQEELMQKMQKVLGKREGKIQIFVFCERDWALRLEVIQEDGGKG